MKFCVFLLGLSLAFPGFAQEAQDTAFLAARDAFRAGDGNKLENAAAQLGAYELAPYVENYRLRLFIDQGDGAAMQAFFQRYENSYVVEKLRADWIRWLGKRSTWRAVESEFAQMLSPEPDVICYNEQARLARNDPNALAAVEQRWLTQLEPPEACRPLFAALAASGKISADDIWNRARRQIEANRPGAAKGSLNYLPDNQAPDTRAFDSLIKSPMGYLARQPASWSSSRSGRELAAFAVQRIAQNDPAAAADVLEKMASRMHDDERQWAWSQIGLQAAKRHLPDAVTWYAKAGNAALSDEASQWKVRSALRAQEWGIVRDSILAMPATLAALPEWVYWLGRAHKAGGLTTEANTLFEKIAGQANFYGNLADEELGRTVMPPPQARAASAEEEKVARENPGMRRALIFFRLDMRTEGVREWNWALRGMDDRALLAAANLAKRHGIWDRAINTADRTKKEHDYSLRFLSPYGEQVRPAAHNQSLDDAWVYGLMRQESRFITSAKSTVGASGLMQLMPATAKWVAKKIGLRNYSHSQVNDTATNVLLGTSYMRLVMENLDNHPVLASAAYNAGPGRAKKWRADMPLEGAIYAETIPFSETRDYVKKVMSNSIYYSALFNGKPDSLKARLGTVGGRTAEVMKDADLP
ncbi:MAG: lytic transglycosylase [Betaproteobacteria bacterium HGW-Betaproteobacteria-10]|nr:MAG: lytic transglycosylase [Betaproteobacteria bacterium HGW-Betaproteobacteria-10]